MFCTSFMPDANGSQKTVLDPLELGLQTVVSYCFLYKSRKCS